MESQKENYRKIPIVSKTIQGMTLSLSEMYTPQEIEIRVLLRQRR